VATKRFASKEPEREEIGPAIPVELPGSDPGPLRKIGRRLVIAIGLICLVAVIAYIGRDGYLDPEDGELSLLDAFYYSSVSVTTTGYGDIIPVTDGARLVTTLVVTPVRVLFLILLVGTTLEILAERTRIAYRINRWRSGLRDHIIICGYGSKGQSAARTMRGTGADPDRIVVIDPRPDERARATAAGYAAVAGSATSKEALEEAEIALARAVIVAVDRDDAAVLATLTARELAPAATIVAAVREEENVHLLQQSGANSVIMTSSAAGRLLGLATDTPGTVEVLEDLLTVGAGLDIVEQTVGEGEGGPLPSVTEQGPVVAVVRGGEVFRFDDERVAETQPGDRVLAIHSHRD